MEIKATLNKPYTDKERADFIVANNHTLGYEIKETETALEAWGLTEEEKSKVEEKARKDNRIVELKQLLAAADYWGQKYLDGEYTEEEWAEKVAQRKAWREEIRSLENANLA